MGDAYPRIGGRLRRRIDLRREGDGAAVGWLEDDFHHFGVTIEHRDGVMTDADELEAEVKRAMIAQSEESVLLLDDSKLGARGQNAIARVTEVSSVLAHGAPAAALEPLRATGVKLRVVGG